eukprot:TRINITY_DN1335_c0_g1_i3.p1 TRINITY_DN1335_c0_g1~~TRINITY_DN1335_c0_g1_i3.p1  ORF type:complete len:268 (-),score=-11.12 TRINITY_DN1335_c0_g1_i3:377-1180(-)
MQNVKFKMQAFFSTIMFQQYNVSHQFSMLVKFYSQLDFNSCTHNRHQILQDVWGHYNNLRFFWYILLLMCVFYQQKSQKNQNLQHFLASRIPCDSVSNYGEQYIRSRMTFVVYLCVFLVEITMMTNIQTLSQNIVDFRQQNEIYSNCEVKKQFYPNVDIIAIQTQIAQTCNCVAFYENDATTHLRQMFVVVSCITKSTYLLDNYIFQLIQLIFLKLCQQLFQKLCMLRCSTFVVDSMFFVCACENDRCFYYFIIYLSNYSDSAILPF